MPLAPALRKKPAVRLSKGVLQNMTGRGSTSMEQENRTEKYKQMREMLNEKQYREFLALEAKERGNILSVARKQRSPEIP